MVYPEMMYFVLDTEVGSLSINNGVLMWVQHIRYSKVCPWQCNADFTWDDSRACIPSIFMRATGKW